jgi:hypothetical protein
VDVDVVCCSTRRDDEPWTDITMGSIYQAELEDDQS